MTTIAVGNGPFGVAITPDGTKAYVANEADATVSVIDTGTLSVIGIPIVVGSGPVAIFANPAGGTVYVANDGGSSVSVIDTTSDTVTATVTGVANPAGIVISPDGSTAYAVGSDQVVVIDTATTMITGTIPEGHGPSQVVISPDGATLYVSNADATVSVIDTGSSTITGTGTLSGAPNGVAITPDGTTLYVSINTETDLTLMDTTALTTTTIASGCAVPVGIAIDPTGTNAYVGDFTGDVVTTILISTATVTGTQGVGSEPAYLAVTPDGSEVYVPNIGSADVTVFGPGVPTPLTGEMDAHVTWADADLTFITPTALTGEMDAHVDWADADLTFATIVPLTGEMDLTVTWADADITPPVPPVSVVCVVVAGDPPSSGFAAALAPMPPSPVPGPYGNHDYEVVVCEPLYGVALGVIPTAIPTQIDWELDGIGQALIDFWIQDPLAPGLLPIESIPGVREIQIWRDQQLIWWGLPTSATWDNVQVHLTCQGLLWPLSQREIGPGYLLSNATMGLVNPQFEEGLDNWTAVDLFAAAEGNLVVLGNGAARLLSGVAGADNFLRQYVSVDCTGPGLSEGIAFALSAWVYLDPNYTPVNPALDQRGLYIEYLDYLGNLQNPFVTIPADFPLGVWTRLEVGPTGDNSPAVIAHGGIVTTFDIRLYCPQGSAIWDAVNFSAYENVSATTVAGQPGTADVGGNPPSAPAGIIATLVASAQEAIWSKSDLALPVISAATGVVLNRIYYADTSSVYLDLLNEFPTDGILDFEVRWDVTGHQRWFQTYFPAKGSVQYNYPIDPDFNETTTLAGALDGTQVGTTQRVLGQGSTGPAADTGWAGFASYLGGRVVTDAVLVLGSNVVNSATANFSADDVGGYSTAVYSLSGGLPSGTFIVTVNSPTQAVLSSAALLNLTGETFGIGGFVIDKSTSALPDQPISTLQKTARGLLLQQMKAQALPAPRLRADGPNGLFGMIDVGDILPVSSNYGWLTFGPNLARIAKLTLYPPTEELEPTLMPVNALPGPS